MRHRRALSFFAVLALVLLTAPPGWPAGGEAPAIPLPEHPRPDFERASWVNLNGEWSFRFDPAGAGEGERWFDTAPGKDDASAASARSCALREPPEMASGDGRWSEYTRTRCAPRTTTAETAERRRPETRAPWGSTSFRDSASGHGERTAQPKSRSYFGWTPLGK